VVRHRHHGDDRCEAGDNEADDPPLRLGIGLPRHLNAITGQDTELSSVAPRAIAAWSRSPPTRRRCPARFVADQYGCLRRASGEHQCVRQHEVDGNGVVARMRHLADDGDADQSARLHHGILE